MLRFRARNVAATFVVAAALVLTLRGQAPDARSSLQIADVGLPAIEEGVIWGESRTPSSDQARAARAAMSQTNAQAAYRVHSTFVPNDPDYSRLQWNLRLINMEKAWDIQPQAGSSITVAVVDTGLAYRSLTITANIRAFTDSAGRRHPALGVQTVPYSAAPQLVGGSASSCGSNPGIA